MNQQNPQDNQGTFQPMPQQMQPPVPQYGTMPQRTSWAAQPVGFVDAITTCLRKYVDFSGRASRSEFWFFTLAYGIASNIPYIGGIISLALLLPDLAVSARRLHDTGKSGWWQVLPNGLLLAGFVLLLTAAMSVADGGEEAANAAVLGSAGIALLLLLASLVVMLVLFCPKGQDSRNKYDD